MRVVFGAGEENLLLFDLFDRRTICTSYRDSSDLSRRRHGASLSPSNANGESILVG